MRAENLVYQIRRENDCSWLFIAHAFRTDPVDIPHPAKFYITVNDACKPVLYDALTGKIEEISYEIKDGKTLIIREMFDQDSLLIKLEQVSESDTDGSGVTTDAASCSETGELNGHGEEIEIAVAEKVGYELEEPNVLLLDMAEYALDGGAFESREEVLRLDNRIREKLGYPLRLKAWAQPWAAKKADPSDVHELTLRYTVNSETEGTEVTLALEDPGDCRIVFNGENVSVVPEGIYVDLDIRKVRIGKLQRGENTLVVSMPYYPARNVEAMYLLGDFGVRLRGSEAVVTEKPEKLCFGDYSVQDMAFYSGNTDYLLDVDVPCDGDLIISVTCFRCPAVAVGLDGVRSGLIAFAPYGHKIGNVKKGRHRIRLTAFGNRMNTFGPLHQNDYHKRSQDPGSWRTKGARWSYEYRTDPAGILKKPEIRLIPLHV